MAFDSYRVLHKHYQDGEEEKLKRKSCHFKFCKALLVDMRSEVVAGFQAHEAQQLFPNSLLYNV